MKQKTIINEVSEAGVGLHTGKKTKITFKPASENQGIIFKRVDLEDVPLIPATVNNVCSTDRTTTLGNKKCYIHTIEHVMSSISGLGIDNIFIELDSEEPPICDGSAKIFTELLISGGIKEQQQDRNFFRLQSPVYFNSGDITLTYLPCEDFKISFTIDFNHSVLSRDFAEFSIFPEIFTKEISPSRTFCFLKEVEELRSRNLISGGSLKNAIVIGDEGILNEEPLRFHDEFVRHKILDLIGDLALIGRPIKGHIIALKSGHRSNISFVQKLLEVEEKNKEFKEISFHELIPVMDIQDILKILPHRYPFILVDRILELEPKKYIKALKNVSTNEPHFLGHYPEIPMMPGVLLLEAIGQAGAILMLKSIPEPENLIPYFISIKDAHFRKPARPGDQLIIEIKMLKFKKNLCKVLGKIFVNNKLIADAVVCALFVRKESITT